VAAVSDHRKQALKQTFARPSVRRSLAVAVAVVVGTMLNFINQGGCLGQWE
jgi:hypothetical protein